MAHSSIKIFTGLAIHSWITALNCLWGGKKSNVHTTWFFCGANFILDKWFVFSLYTKCIQMAQFENESFAYLIALGLTGQSGYYSHCRKPL